MPGLMQWHFKVDFQCLTFSQLKSQREMPIYATEVKGQPQKDRNTTVSW